MVAGNPKTLAGVVARAERENKDLTVEYVRRFNGRKANEGKAKDRHKHLAGHPEPDAARVVAFENDLSAAADVQEWADARASTYRAHVEQLSATERSRLFAAVTKAAPACNALAAIVKPTVELREAAE